MVTVGSNTNVAVSAPTANGGLVYDGSVQTGVAAGEGYTVANGSATDAGTYTATLSLLGGYVWSDGTYADKTVEYAIERAPLAASMFAVDALAKTYTGSAITPAVESSSLASGVDYVVGYADNVNVGTATITIAGKGNYAGTLT